MFHFFCSFGLATGVLIALLLITLLGTLEQVEHGLYETTHKYFDSPFLSDIDIGCCLRAFHIAHQGHLVLPLQLKFGQTAIPFVPSGYLLMVVLFINLALGAVVRIRKSLRNFGVILAHLSILFMLIAGFVSFYFKTEGSMTLAEGQTSNEFQSFNDSVIEIQRVFPVPDASKDSVMIIDGREYKDLSEDKARLFTSKDLPFDLLVSNYEVNAEPRKLKEGETRLYAQADGYFIQPKARDPEAEKNFDAAFVKVTDKKTKEEHTGILWRVNAAPFAVKVGDEMYTIDLTRRKWTLPFAVRLDKFEREFHPGTGRPRKFTSAVTRNPGGHEEKKIITMNAPYREPASHFWEGNYVLFQHSFGQAESGNGPVRSVLEVVRNPSDQWPLYALFAAMLGLLIHMIMRLSSFLTRYKPTPVGPPPAA